MATTLEDSYSLATNPRFRARVKSALAIAASDVFGETPSGIPTKDQKRRDLAFEIIRGIDRYVDIFAVFAAVKPGVGFDDSANPKDTATDGDIQFTVNALFDDVAGYDPNQS